MLAGGPGIDFLHLRSALPAAEPLSLKEAYNEYSSFCVPVLCAIAFGVSAPAFAQGVENAVPPVAATTGKFVFTFTVTVSSTVPTNGVVVCEAIASVNESSGQSIQQTAVGIVTPSGGKATCTATMPHAWTLASASSDKVILSYKVELDYGYQVTASNGTSTGVQLVSSDKVTENLATISVPLNGATTNESVTATI